MPLESYLHNLTHRGRSSFLLIVFLASTMWFVPVLSTAERVATHYILSRSRGTIRLGHNSDIARVRKNVGGDGFLVKSRSSNDSLIESLEPCLHKPSMPIQQLLHIWRFLWQRLLMKEKFEYPFCCSDKSSNRFNAESMDWYVVMMTLWGIS